MYVAITKRAPVDQVQITNTVVFVYHKFVFVIFVYHKYRVIYKYQKK